MERVHKLSAVFVFAFLCLHFANHFAGLFGEAAHAHFMDAARILYRHPYVEGAVLAAFALQVATGIPLILEIWSRKKDFVHQLMALSGAVMTLYIVLHVGWVVAGRQWLNLDTNFSYAAAGLTSARWKTAYTVFHAAGVFSLFVHFACIAYDIFKKTSRPAAWTCLVVVTALGGYVTWLLISLYSGHLYPVTIPADYIQVFGGR